MCFLKWRFPEIGVPLVIIHFHGIIPYKPSVLGYPPFQEPPKWGRGAKIRVPRISAAPALDVAATGMGSPGSSRIPFWWGPWNMAQSKPLIYPFKTAVWTIVVLVYYRGYILWMVEKIRLSPVENGVKQLNIPLLIGFQHVSTIQGDAGFHCPIHSVTKIDRLGPFPIWGQNQSKPYEITIFGRISGTAIKNWPAISGYRVCEMVFPAFDPWPDRGYETWGPGWYQDSGQIHGSKSANGSSNISVEGVEVAIWWGQSYTLYVWWKYMDHWKTILWIVLFCKFLCVDDA